MVPHVILPEAIMSQGTEDLETFSVRLSKRTGDRLRAIAAAEDRPVAAEIRRLITQRVDEADRAAA